MFPIIHHIDDIAEALEGRDEFVASIKNGYIAVDYVYKLEDTFSTPLRCELRGIIFGNDGNILRRTPHKFFNMNEVVETKRENLPDISEAIVTEKLDGSLISPFIVDGEVLWGTKMGVTDISLLCNDFLEENPHYNDFARYCIEKCGVTPSFEFTTLKNRIVLPYEKDCLTLFAMREIHTGNYIPFADMRELAFSRAIFCVEQYDASSSFVDDIADWQDREGVVMIWEDSDLHMKIKCDWYVRLHSALEVTRFENNFIDVIINDNIDDLLPALEGDMLDFATRYNGTFLTNVVGTFDSIIKKVESMKPMERKEFSSIVREEQPNELHFLFFHAYDNSCVSSMMDKFKFVMRRRTGSRSKIEMYRSIFGCEEFYDNRLEGKKK